MRLILLCFAIFFAAPALAEKTMTFAIATSPLSEIDATESQKVVEYVNAILTDVRYGGVACSGVVFRRDPTVKQVEIGDAIDTQEDLNALFDDDSHSVYLVRSINYCGGVGLPPFSGCGLRGRPIVVVFNNLVKGARAIKTDGVIWLHEFGHSQGLGHSNEANSVMQPSAATHHTALSNSDCTAMRGDNPTFEREIVVAGDSSPATAVDSEGPLAADASSPESETEKILAEVWAEGLPYARLQALPAGALDEVRRILVDPDRLGLWANGVSALGALGDESDILYLLSFFERTRGMNSPYSRTARLRVALAIGLLAARNDTSTGLNFLRNRMNPNASLGEFADDIKEAEFLAREFAKDALRGIALADGARSSTDMSLRNVDLMNAQAAQTAGAFDLGVDDAFFDYLNEMRKTVNQKGLDALLKGEE